MLLSDFVAQVSELLNIRDFEGIDNALNGLQVSRADQEIRRVGLAVDASIASFQRAVAAGADLLVVHHGLFWGKPAPVTGNLFTRIRYLMENDLALFAAHLPMDCHPEIGNNIGLAKHLGLRDTEPFGDYKGIRIGWKGTLAEEMELEELQELICGSRQSCLGVLPFGPQKIRRVGIVSGGLPGAVTEAIENNLDLFVTGDSSHTIYHECLEAGINVLFAGHYATETWGIRSLRNHIESWKSLETTFIDVPTGL